jgi:tetratricopeptide (TPR) repeat protein
MAESATLYQHHPDLKRLLKAVKRAGEEFALFFVECNLPALRNELAEVLASDMLPPPVRVDISLLTSDTQQLDELIALQVGETAAPVFLFGLEQWLPSLSEDKLRATVQQLNWRRNRFASLQRPLVIWLPHYALNILAEQTPDFYDWYSGVFVFQASAKQQAQEEGNNLQAIWSGNRIHAAYRLNIEEKKRWLHTLLELLQEHTQADAGRATLLVNLATLMISLGDYSQALDYLQQSLKIQREIGDKAGEGTTLNNMGTIAQARGDYATALDYLQQSLKIQQEIGDKAGVGTTLNNLSQIYQARGDYATALDYLQQSLKIQQEIGDKKGVGATLNNLSQIYDARGDYATALDYLQQSLKIQQEIGDKKGVGATLNNLSQIYKARGDYATALDYLQQSLKIQQEIGDKAGLCATLFNIGHIHHQNEASALAMQYWQESYQIAKEIGLSEVLNALQNLAGQLGLPNGLAGWEQRTEDR